MKLFLSFKRVWCFHLCMSLSRLTIHNFLLQTSIKIWLPQHLFGTGNWANWYLLISVGKYSSNQHFGSFKKILYNFGVEDKIWLNDADILVAKGQEVGEGEDPLSSCSCLSNYLIQYVNKNKYKYLKVGLVTRTTFLIDGSQKLYVTKVHKNMVLLLLSSTYHGFYIRPEPLFLVILTKTFPLWHIGP